MQAYTEEQRKALIGLCRIEIKRWKAASESNPNMRYMVELMEAALAALTAPLVAAPAVPDEALIDKVCLTAAGIFGQDDPDEAQEIVNRIRAMLAAAPSPSNSL